MRSLFPLAAIALTFALAITQYSQTAPPGPTKVAIINSDAFADEKAGVTKLVNAYKVLQTEFKPASDELAAMATKIDNLAKEIQQLQSQINSNQGDPNAIRTTIEQKNDEGNRLQIDLKRKQEDAKERFAKREKQLTEPIVREIGAALDAYAKKNSIDLILDITKLGGAVLMLNNAIEITDVFIKDFNAKAVGIPVK